MKTHRILGTALLFAALRFTGFAQSDLKFEVHPVIPAFSIQENQVASVRTLTDLNPRYPATWIKTYLSVEVSALKKGTLTTASGKSEVLTSDQLNLLQSADPGTEIMVRVNYMPNNNLANETEKQYQFTTRMVPSKSATFAEGSEQLMAYLQKNCIALIPPGSFKDFDLTAIRFTVTAQGQIKNVQVSLPSKDPKMDDMLTQALSAMPTWKAAELSNETKVDQDFVLTIGNMENCMVNLLNIRPAQ